MSMDLVKPAIKKLLSTAMTTMIKSSIVSLKPRDLTPLLPMIKTTSQTSSRYHLTTETPHQVTTQVVISKRSMPWVKASLAMHVSSQNMQNIS